MTEKWTPGPWSAVKNGALVPTEIWNDAGTVLIADCASDSLRDGIEADAHLIAAAPDLYEAVRLLLSSRSAHPDPEVVERRVIEGLNKGLAAMRKAKGEG